MARILREHDKVPDLEGIPLDLGTTGRLAFAFLRIRGACSPFARAMATVWAASGRMDVCVLRRGGSKGGLGARQFTLRCTCDPGHLSVLSAMAARIHLCSGLRSGSRDCDWSDVPGPASVSQLVLRLKMQTLPQGCFAPLGTGLSALGVGFAMVQL
jgi:hypothetical protein